MSDLKDVQPGDTVRLLHENGDFAVVKVVSTGRCTVFASGDTWFDTTNGWTITDIEQPKPELPTEPGWYAAFGSGPGGVLMLSLTGGWWWAGNMYQVNGERLTDDAVADLMPLTRLEPVTVTAKKVLGAVGDYLDGQLSGRTRDDILRHIAAELGVES